MLTRNFNSPSEEPNEEAPADEDAKNGEDLAPSDDQQLNPSKDGQENGLAQPEDEEIPQPKNEEHDETFQNEENEPPSPTVEDAREENVSILNSNFEYFKCHNSRIVCLKQMPPTWAH